MAKETKETKEDFYDFGMLMSEDSELLYENERWHNSVYFAVFALEAYVKIILLKNDKNHVGHIGQSKLSDNLRDCTTIPNLFNIDNFPNMKEYEIGKRYMVKEWADLKYRNVIQDELKEVKDLLLNLRSEGFIH